MLVVKDLSNREYGLLNKNLYKLILKSLPINNNQL